MFSSRRSTGSSWQHESGEVNPYFLGTIIVLTFFVFAIGGCAGCTTITPGNVGIVISKTGSSRGVQDVTIKTGRVWANPITTEVIEYPTYVQTLKWTKSADEGSNTDESITFTSKDSMIVNADISISYELNQDKAPNFYVKFRADKISSFSDSYLRNVVRDTFNEAAGKYTVEQIMGDNADLLKTVKASVQTNVLPYGIAIDQLGFIGAPRPPQIVLNSINSKVQAQQIGLQKQNELVQATADAQKRIASAEGQAKANQELSSSLTPQLLEWRKLDIQERAVEKWNGVRPHVEAGGVNGFMIDTK
jgi:regulator of protease activity HflC (stomatin/prohibitin superfamily)